ncbi:MAG: insulinase family protein, partial [Desulfobulbaceae bacterium]|nr:insulinase family protein [Desulfobulbaceae bacterium]
MIFKGTPTRGPGELAMVIEELGGSINAYTSYEYTVYHATLSARHWATASEVLADALLNSVFDQGELEREKKVVLEEIGMRNDRPSIKLIQKLMEESYSTHPYRLPIIGTVESVSGFSRDDILDYIKRHYVPENFTMVVVGDVKFAQVLEKAKELFSKLPGTGYVQPVLPQEPEQKSIRLFKIEEDIKQTHMALAFPITPFDHPDTPVLDVIASIVGQGEASRLYHELRNGKGLVYRISGAAFTPRDSGLMEISALLDAEKIVPALEAALEQVFKLKYIPVSDRELERVKRNLESDFVFNLERVEGQARVLGAFEFLAGDPREDEYLEKIRAVTREDILQVANRYFDRKRVTAGFVVPTGTEVDLDRSAFESLCERAENMARHGIPASMITDAFLSNLHQFRLPNGMKILVREDPKVPTVAIRVVFPGGLKSETPATNGSFAFISELMPKSTEKLPPRELTLTIADMAGEISGFNGKNTFGVKAEFLSRFFDKGMELVRDVLRTPSFDQEEAEKIRSELLAHLKQQEDSLPSLAFREFNRLLFQDHPYGLNTAGSEAVIKEFTIPDLLSIYREFARPDKMVLAVSGDVEAEKVRDLVETLFGDWTVQDETESAIEEDLASSPVSPAEPEIFTLVRERDQVHIIIGFLGSTLEGKDRFALEVLDTIMSGQSGRLFMELRDKMSLAYSLSSFSFLGIDTGSVGIYIGTSPDKRDDAIKAVWNQIYMVRQEPVSEEELKRARNTLIGHYELGLQTHGAQALEIALSEIYDLGQDFGKRYLDEIGKVTPEMVQEAAQKYFQPDHYVMVTVGAGSK